MVKGEYIKYGIVYFLSFIILLNSQLSIANPWLPGVGEYEIVITYDRTSPKVFKFYKSLYQIIDKFLESLKQTKYVYYKRISDLNKIYLERDKRSTRELLYVVDKKNRYNEYVDNNVPLYKLIIKDNIETLQDTVAELEKLLYGFSNISEKLVKSVKHKLQGSLIMLKRLGLDSKINNLGRDAIKEYLTIEESISKLRKEVVVLLTHYPKYYGCNTISTIFEYGIFPRFSCGFKFFCQRGTNFNKYVSSKEYDFFTKFQLYNSKKFVLSVQPRLVTRSTILGTRRFYETSLSIGYINYVKLVKFTHIIEFGTNLKVKQSATVNYFKYNITEIVGLRNNLMIIMQAMNYSYKPNHKRITIVRKQLSVAKYIPMINKSKILKQGLTIQFGYFTEYYKQRKIQIGKGVFLSLWIKGG